MTEQLTQIIKDIGKAESSAHQAHKRLDEMKQIFREDIREMMTDIKAMKSTLESDHKELVGRVEKLETNKIYSEGKKAGIYAAIGAVFTVIGFLLDKVF